MAEILTIIIPVFNEEDNLLQLSNALTHFLDHAIVNTKVLFVNDGSTDNSQQIIEEECARHSLFNYIQFQKNQGLSAALKAGIDHVDTHLVGYMDADLQTDPMDFNLLLEYSDTYTLVNGIRSNRKDNYGKRISSLFANRFRRLFTKDGMDDTGCPLKVLRTDYAKRIPMFKGLHRFIPAMILLQQGTVKQVPVKHFPRYAGSSKFGFWNRSIGPFTDCFVYLWMKRRYINYEISKTDL